MNVAAKMNSLTEPNKISIGNNIYQFLHPSLQTKFHKINVTESEWKYTDQKSHSLYEIYTS